MLMNTTTIHLAGLGCVGQGLYDLIQRRPEAGFAINRIAVKNPDKIRRAADAPLGFRPEFLFEGGAPDVIVEAIDDADTAYQMAIQALESGIPLVSANKKMLALYLSDLLALQQRTGTPLLYEAAVCGAIPILRTLSDHYSSDRIQRIEAIVNGTTNFILTQQRQHNLSYVDALGKAQELGFAESDPTNDVEGFDAAFKTILLAWQAFGVILSLDDIPRWGITTLGTADAAFAAQQGGRIRLVATLLPVGEQLVSTVLPTLVGPRHPLYGVELEGNAVALELEAAGKHVLSGPGAGAFPTASALLADLHRLRDGYRYPTPLGKTPLKKAVLNEIGLPVRLRAPEGLVEVLIPRRDRQGLTPADEDSALEGVLSLHSILRFGQDLRKAGVSLLALGAPQSLLAEEQPLLQHVSV